MLRSKKNKAILRMFLILIVLLAVFISLKFLNIPRIYRTGSIGGLVTDLRAFSGILLFIALCAVRPLFVVLPSSPMAIAAGSVYGPLLGWAIVIASSLLSGTVGFFAAHLIGRDYFDRITHHKILKIKSKIEEGSWASVLFLNFIGISWDLTSIAAGLSKIRYKDYLLAICISAPIQGFILVNFGNILFSARSLADIFQIKMLFVLLVTAAGITLPLIIKKRLKRKASSQK